MSVGDVGPEPGAVPNGAPRHERRDPARARWPDPATVYVAGLFVVVVVCLFVLALPVTAADAADRTAVTAIGSAAMGVLSGLLARLPQRKDR